MDPLAINWIELVERLGVPVAMCVFICVLYVRQVRLSRIDRLACAKELSQLRSYTDRSLENMRRNQNQERVAWMESMNVLTHDLTAVLNDLLKEMKIKREQEERDSKELLDHIDRVIEQRVRDERRDH